jgi:hypothetical protein
MKLSEAVYDVISGAPAAVTPQHVRDEIKRRYPDLYGTDMARRNVEKGNYHDLDHALLAPIYTICRNDERYVIDRSTKPFRVSVESNAAVEEALDSDVGEDPEQEVGTLYVLSTGVFTREGKRIVKIGFTTQDIAIRIKQLYTTGAMFQFEEVKSYRVTSYDLVEHALHKLLAPFRLNNAREFFTDDVLPYVEEVVQLHQRIQVAAASSA